MIPKNELKTLIMALDYFEDAFSIGEEMPPDRYVLQKITPAFQDGLMGIIVFFKR